MSYHIVSTNNRPVCLQACTLQAPVGGGESAYDLQGQKDAGRCGDPQTIRCQLLYLTEVHSFTQLTVLIVKLAACFPAVLFVHLRQQSLVTN